MTDGRVLDALADELDVDLRPADDVEAARAELAGSAPAPARPSAPPAVAPAAAGRAGAGEAVLATWHQLLDAGRPVDGDEQPGRHGQPAGALISAATAAGDRRRRRRAGHASRTERGAVTLPGRLIADLPDGVVWLPTNSPRLRGAAQPRRRRRGDLVA